MKVLYIGGTGEISHACVEHSVQAGHEVAVFNRGLRVESLPTEVVRLTGDLTDPAAYQRLAAEHFDVVCQFLVFDEADMARDLELFSGHCGQYVFISSASAYAKPPRGQRVTEATPLDNPYWRYSRMKAACEALLTATEGRLPHTIVRPSHTYRRRFPSTVIDGNHLAWRILHDEPVLVHDDGESLWTLTHADDFARAFVRLLGLERALGAQCHITSDQSYSWNQIISEVGAVLGKRPDIRHVASAVLVAEAPELKGPLLGDKANNLEFDNSRIRDLIGSWDCEVRLREGLDGVCEKFLRLLEQGYRPEPDRQDFLDRLLGGLPPQR